jgi:hypothetical protein
MSNLSYMLVPRLYHEVSRVSKVFPEKTQNRVPSLRDTSQIKGMKQNSYTAPPIQRWLTTSEICELLSVSRNTYAKWRQRGVAPKAVRLPNGELRTRLDWLDAFLLDDMEVA